MKLHILIISFLLAGVVVVGSLPVDSTVHGARDARFVQQSLKSFDVDVAQRLNELPQGVSFDKSLKSSGNEFLVSEKKATSSKSSKTAKKQKTKNQKNKGKKVKASPTKTKKQ